MFANHSKTLYDPKKDTVPGIDHFAEVIVSTLRAELKRHNIPTKDIMIEFEPGRSMYGPTGIHLTKVLQLKTQTHPIKHSWCITDSTIWSLDHLMDFKLFRYKVANQANAKTEIVADICGITCGEDRMQPFAVLPKVVPGDLIAFFDTGCYCDPGTNNINALPRPGTVLVTGNKARWIKTPETVEDVFRRDVIPEEFLKKSK